MFSVIDKKLSEADVISQFIMPAVIGSNWSIKNQIRQEYTFTDGRIILRKDITVRGRQKRVDIILFYKKNLPLAVIEAKDQTHSVGAGLQQGVGYAQALDIPYVYASNGQGFVEQNLLTGEVKEIALTEFPSPEELYKRYLKDKGLTPQQEQIVNEPYYYAPGAKEPRYYQRVAVNRTVEAVAKGQERVLLVCATGTGKTFMAFQIIHRLWKSGQKKKILFLADRNILVDQTMTGDFKPFGDKMTKIGNKKLDSAYEIYLSLYQQLAGDDGSEAFRQFQPDFFDLIVIDECHRGSAKEDSAWRKILDYFSSATHIGCTATPIETAEASSQSYFGEPIYEYSLKQGIEDGFLAPYKVIRVGLDKDLNGYRPELGKVDKYGHTVEDREYDAKDFDRKIVLDDRTRTVAKKVTEFLQKTDPYSKTIVFCVDIEHAERMRQALINENRELYLENNRYVMRITGDNDEGKAQLDNFIDEESRYPVIAVTSKLMTTGVDAKMCKLIVLDSNINSMTEFKQIIGRGTRLLESYGKKYFNIIDFRNVSRLFADPGFDGNPIVEIDIPNGGEIDEPIIDTEPGDGEDVSILADPPIAFPGTDDEHPRKYYINDVEVNIISERVQYIDASGNLITESLIDYTKKNILQQYAKLDDFLHKWSQADKKKVILDELQDQGVLFDAVREELGKQDLDEFDIICHLAFDQPPLTKKERANNVKKRNYFAKYSDTAREVLEILLEKYANEGVKEIEQLQILQLQEFQELGGPVSIVKAFGGKNQYLAAVQQLEQQIYTQV